MNGKNLYKIAVLGGDKRQAAVAAELAACGHRIRYMGCGDVTEGCEICTNVDKAMEGADIAVLPLPVTRDNMSILVGNSKVDIDNILKLAMKNNTLLLGGIVPDELNRVCLESGIEIIDYYKIESLQQRNALPSAEGALMVAMEHTDITVCGMRTLVAGYGRIGRILADILKKLGACVTVAARRDETLCEISMSGLDAIRIGGEELATAVSKCDVIFNTVPSVIFSEKLLKSVNGSPLYIEIASSPGGIDIKAARDAGVEIVLAPSLPGRYAPVSAGKYVFETISEILSERRIKI